MFRCFSTLWTKVLKILSFFGNINFVYTTKILNVDVWQVPKCISVYCKIIIIIIIIKITIVIIIIMIIIIINQFSRVIRLICNCLAYWRKFMLKEKYKNILLCHWVKVAPKSYFTYCVCGHYLIQYQFIEVCIYIYSSGKFAFNLPVFSMFSACSLCYFDMIL